MLTILTILTILSCDIGLVSNDGALSSKGKDNSLNGNSFQTQQELEAAAAASNKTKDEGWISWEDIEDEFDWLQDSNINWDRDTEPSSGPSSWGF